MINTLLKIVVLAISIQFLACEKKVVSNEVFYIQNEPYYKYAWHFNYNSELAQYFNIDPNSHINIQEAWNITKGKGVKIAVIDSYFDINHEDLKANIINVHSIDNKDGDVSNKTDDPAHGSTVAGFIASPVNGKGLIGAAPEAKLILIQQAYVDDNATIKAFEYAKNSGAQVINCSWGTESVSEMVADTIQELKDNGITIIFASGNDGADLDRNSVNDESELPSVIGVGASNELNDIAYYSNYGQDIDLIAPGGDTYELGILGIDDTGQLGSTNQRGLSNNYAFTQGTSFAAPLTAGVVALMLSVNPSLTPDQIREILIQSADKVGSNANYIDGFDTYRAHGKLNAAKAVKLAQSY